MDKLDIELRDTVFIFERKLSLLELERQLSELDDMVRFVEKCILAERALFEPERLDEDPEQPPVERFAELAAWSEGRQQLHGLLDRVCNARATLRGRLDELRISERAIQEFAALRECDFERFGYIEVIGSILGFIDRLKKTWNELFKEGAGCMDLERSFMATAPLRMTFGADCLAEAFDLWVSKASSGCRLRWDDGARTARMQELFRLFDTDGDGVIDIEELGVTIHALGIEFPDGMDIYRNVLASFDENSDGFMQYHEFQRFVESRILATFRLFLPSPTNANITKADLARVAWSIGYTGIADETLHQMICLLDTRLDHKVDVREFEQLILMKPEAAEDVACFQTLQSPMAAGHDRRRTRLWCLHDKGK